MVREWSVNLAHKKTRLHGGFFYGLLFSRSGFSRVFRGRGRCCSILPATSMPAQAEIHVLDLHRRIPAALVRARAGFAGMAEQEAHLSDCCTTASLKAIFIVLKFKYFSSVRLN